MEMSETQAQLSADPLELGTPPLQIEGYYVKELQFSVRDDLDEKSNLALGTGLHIQVSDVMSASPEIAVEIGIGQHLKDNLRFRIMLRVKSAEDDQSPYMFGTTLIGYFCLQGIKENQKALLFYRNALMLLYSAAREIIASATARGPFPAFILPTLALNLSPSILADIRAQVETHAKELAAKKAHEQLSPAPAKKRRSKKNR